MAHVSSLSGSAGGYGESAAVKQQTMSMLEEAVELIAEAAIASGKTADALCGSTPECAATGDGQKIGAGVFDRIEELAKRLRLAAMSISTDMNRIQNRL